MSTQTFIQYDKQYLPGYTGHVPKKNEIYGCTAGDINKLITKEQQKPSPHDIDVAVCKPYFDQNDYHVNLRAQDVENDKLQYGNTSKKGENWIGGPNQNVKAQHIPGYQGYIPQVRSENLYGKSFAKTTAKAINGEYEKGFDHSIKNRFTTEDAAEFGKDNFRLLKNDIEPAEVKDIVDAFNFHDAEFQGIEITEKRAYMDLPTVGYTGHKSMYKMPTTQINHRKDPFFNINSLRPRLNMDEGAEAAAATQPEQTPTAEQAAKSESAGSKRQTALNSSSYREMLGVPDAKNEMRLPVVGYTGHRMGYRAQNFYGKNFKDCAIQSKIISKMTAL